MSAVSTSNSSQKTIPVFVTIYEENETGFQAAFMKIKLRGNSQLEISAECDDSRVAGDLVEAAYPGAKTMSIHNNSRRGPNDMRGSANFRVEILYAK